MIAFCGVHFMAETAKILNPRRPRVVDSRSEGGLFAGRRLPARSVREDSWPRTAREHPDLVVVSYVNTSAAVKALSDVDLHVVERS